jgi:hypothetical protein
VDGCCWSVMQEEELDAPSKEIPMFGIEMEVWSERINSSTF